MHRLALLPSKGYCVLHMLQSGGQPCPAYCSCFCSWWDCLAPKAAPKARSHSPHSTPPSTPPPAPDDSIAIESCDSDLEIDCDADSVASFEALDKAKHIGVDTQD